MKNNKLKKINTTNLANGGLLPPKKATKFFDTIVDESALKNEARFELVTSGKFEIPKLNIAERVMFPRGEGQSANNDVTATSELVTIATHSMSVVWAVSSENYRRNIEEKGFKKTLQKAIGKRMANNMEEIAISSEIGSTVHPSLSKFDGWLKILETTANSNDLSKLADKSLSPKVFSQLRRSMPTKYRNNKSELRYFVNFDDFEDYTDSLAARNTGMGDKVTESGGIYKAGGIKIVPAAYIPQGTVILTPTSNLIIAMDRDSIEILEGRLIRSNMYEYAIHCEIGVGIENHECAVITTAVEAYEEPTA